MAKHDIIKNRLQPTPNPNLNRKRNLTRLKNLEKITSE